MIEINTLWAVFFASIGFLVFVYKQIVSAGLKSKLLALKVRRKNNFKQDSIQDCLQNRRNQRLLSSLFYRVNLIDLYVKKIIPIVMFSGILFLIASVFLFEDKHIFRTSPSKDLTTVNLINKNGTSTDLDVGGVIYKTSKGEFIYFKAENGGIFSLSDSYSLRLGFALLIGVLTISIVFCLAVAYFKNLTSIDDVRSSLEEDIKFLNDELKVVAENLAQQNTKSDEEYKKERLNALGKKLQNLQDSLEEIVKIESEISKIKV